MCTNYERITVNKDSRLISLLEIMRIFQPDLFIRAAEILNTGERPSPARRRSNSNDPSLSTPEERLVHVKQEMRKWHEILYHSLEPICRESGLKASAATVRRMIQALDNDPNREDSKEWDAELRGRLIDEMTETVFFSLTPQETEYYSEPRKGWEKIIERFGDTVGDIEEARKCFALSRYAAAIFHTLQIVEFGLIELGGFIKVTDPLSGWTATTNRLRQIMKTKYDGRTDFEKANHVFLEQVQGTVEALQAAWRNKISHAQGKLTVLTSDFTPDIAEEIIFATRSFMRRLAEGLPPVYVEA
jgi:hypothetical protein